MFSSVVAAAPAAIYSEANARHYSFARRRHSPRNDMSINSAPNVQTIAAPEGKSHQ
jgi:hypothetical protein